MAYPRFVRSRQMKKKRRSSGNLTLNSTAWTNVDTGLDLVLNEVQVGDEIVYGISGLWGAEGVDGYLDVVTIVGGTPVNSFAEKAAVVTTPGAIVNAWYGQSSSFSALGGIASPYTVVVGDLVDGGVTLRLRYATSAATNKTLYGSGKHILDVWAMNLGPVQE